jgi:hypothetical protein
LGRANPPTSEMFMSLPAKCKSAINYSSHSNGLTSRWVQVQAKTTVRTSMGVRPCDLAQRLPTRIIARDLFIHDAVPRAAAGSLGRSSEQLWTE